MNKIAQRILLTIVTTSLCSTVYASTRYMTILRHGEGEHNVQHFYSSNPNHPNYRIANLTELGKQQVTYTAQKLKIQGLCDQDVSVAIVSPLPRTQQTANILTNMQLFDPNKITIDPRVIEVQAGSLEGQHYDPSVLDWNHPHPNATGDEDNKSLRCRMQNFYNDVVKRYPQGNIIIVTHGSPSLHLIELISDEKIQLKTADSITLPITRNMIDKEVC